MLTMTYKLVNNAISDQHTASAKYCFLKLMAITVELIGENNSSFYFSVLLQVTVLSLILLIRTRGHSWYI